MVDMIDKYSNMMPIELRMFVGDSPKDDLDWGVIMYLFVNTKSGNIITLGKMSNFFGIDSTTLFEKLNKMSGLWVRQYFNSGGYGRIYYTYEITEIAADFIIKLIELLEIATKDKDDREKK